MNEEEWKKSFEASNGALQQRAISLNVDYERANTFPQDYDTDLESEWSNLSKDVSSNSDYLPV